MITMDKPNIVELSKLQREVLGHEGLGFTELRVIDGTVKSYFSRYENDYRARINENEDKQIYVGINPRVRESGRASDVACITCIVIDIDPVRPKGQASTDEQHKDAIRIGAKIVEDFPGAVGVSSGSGSHVYFPIPTTPVDSIRGKTSRLRLFTEGIRKKYQTKEQKIDSIFDLSRVIRVWGSYNSKSNRYCVPLDSNAYWSRLDLGLDEKTPEAPKELGPLSPDVEERFHNLCMNNIQMSRIVRNQSKFDSRSEADYAFISILAQAHFKTEDIKELVKRNPLGRGEDIREDDVERVVDKCTQNGLGSYSLIHNADSYYESLDNRKFGLRTGLKQFDEMISGLKNQKVYVFAARPTDGKTSIITQILANLAGGGKTCLFFPTEVGAEPIYDKIISAKAGINLKKFQNGTFNDDERQKITACRKSLSSLPLVYEDGGLTTETIEKAIQTTAPQVVAIDYLQAMKFKEGSPAELGNAVIAIKALAVKYNIPIILASQLKRGSGDAKADLSMLKGTGALEEATDVVSFLFTVDKNSYPRTVDLCVMKSKYSAVGDIKLNFFSSICKFEEKL